MAMGSEGSAEDRAEVSTSLFAEKREGGKGGLTVIHPQALFGIDLGRFVSLDVAYAADAVSGATATPISWLFWPPPFGLGTICHAWPFQCSVSVRKREVAGS